MSPTLGHILPFYQLIPSKQHLPLQFIHSESQNSQSYQNTPRSPHFPYQSTPTVPGIPILASLLLFSYFSVFLSPIILSLFIYLSTLAPEPIPSPIHPLYTLHIAILALLHNYPPFSYPILPLTQSPTHLQTIPYPGAIPHTYPLIFSLIFCLFFRPFFRPEYPPAPLLFNKEPLLAWATMMMGSL